METALVTLAGQPGVLAVTLGGKTERYTLSVAPGRESALVARERAEILHQLDLPAMIQNLDNAVDLLDVAYDAVNGRADLQPRVRKIQATLIILTGNSLTAVQGFNAKIQLVLLALIRVYQDLKNMMEELAIDDLQDIAKIADAMTNAAKQLEKDFRKLADETENVLEDTMREKGKDMVAADAIREQLGQFQAEQKGLEAAQETVSLRLKTLRSEYSDIKDKIDQQESRQNTLDILSMVFTFLGSAGSGIAQQAGAQQGEGASSSDSEAEDPQLAAQKAEKGKVDARLAEITKREQAIKTQLETLGSQRSKLSEDLASAAEGDKPAIQAEQQKIDDTQAALRQENVKLGTEKETLTGKQKELQSGIAAIAGAFEGVSKKADQINERNSSAITENRAQMRKLYEDMMKLEEANTKNLTNLARFTEQIANTKVTKNSLELAVKSLIISISCLKRVVMVIQQMAEFWDAIKTCCASLSESNLGPTIKKVQESYDEEKRLKFYQSPRIMEPLLYYMARWAALNTICDDYLEAVKNIKGRMDEVAAAPEGDREEHWKRASEKAVQVGRKLDTQAAESKKRQGELCVQMDAQA